MDRRIDAVPELQFPEYVFQMTLDGGGTDTQYDGDLFVSFGEGNETQNSPFCRGHLGHGYCHPPAGSVDSIHEIASALSAFLGYGCVALHHGDDFSVISEFPIFVATVSSGQN
jgi:hypothetical protein